MQFVEFSSGWDLRPVKAIFTTPPPSLQRDLRCKERVQMPRIANA